MSRARRALLVLAAALALSGCLRVGPGEDLHLVCERESTSPWHPYAPDELAAMASVEGEASPGERLRLFAQAADRLVTPGARPYDAFEARLVGLGGGGWRFEANGTMGDSTDVYVIALPNASATVEAPATLARLAHAIARGSSVVEGPATSVARATWTRDLAGCVRLDYADGTTVWSNLDKGQVVSFDRAQG